MKNSNRQTLTDAVAAIRRLSEAIAPNRVGSQVAGVHVESLTEAVMSVGAGIVKIADAIEVLAEAVSGRLADAVESASGE